MPTNRFEVSDEGWDLFDENNEVVAQSVEVSDIEDAHRQAGRAQHAAQYARIVNKDEVELAPSPEPSTVTPTTEPAGKSSSSKK